METIKRTFVFESKEAFMEEISKDVREKAHLTLFNGVSKEFAKEHPNYEHNNETNSYCWDCLDCVNCFGCDNCTDCVWCQGCISCNDCIECENCRDTRYSVKCENINNSLDCHFVQYAEFNEFGYKYRMDEPV